MNRRTFASLFAFFGIAPAVAAQDSINMGRYDNGKCPVCGTEAGKPPRIIVAGFSPYQGKAFVETCSKCKVMFVVEIK